MDNQDKGLTHKEFSTIAVIVQEMDKRYSKKINDSNLTHNIVLFFLQELKRNFGDVQYQLLKKNGEDTLEVYAFKFDRNRPELYLLRYPDKFEVLDEYNSDLYSGGFFIRPIWN